VVSNHAGGDEGITGDEPAMCLLRRTMSWLRKSSDSDIDDEDDIIARMEVAASNSNKGNGS